MSVALIRALHVARESFLRERDAEDDAFTSAVGGSGDEDDEDDEEDWTSVGIDSFTYQDDLFWDAELVSQRSVSVI